MQVPINRRSFLAGVTAASYSRVLGANDRISLGQIGTGNRGSGLTEIVASIKDKQNVEITAVCDLWSHARDRAADQVRTQFGRAPRAFQHMEDLLALRDVDAVLIATGDFQHSPILKIVVEAGKDAYCEKPMGNVLEEAAAARDAVRRTGRIVQIGTQHRSEPYQLAVRDLIRGGALGEITKIEFVWNYHGPRWRGRPEVNFLREQDTDWRRWLLKKPYRPFDPRVYLEFRLYRDFSSGIADQWLSHSSDLVHLFMDEKFPRSVCAHGGVFAWKDGRENPDTFQTLIEYPKGFLVSYSTSFGNDCPSFARIMGKKATLINTGGEGSPRWHIVEEKGTFEDDPSIKRAEKPVLLHGDPPNHQVPTFISDNVEYHMVNWVESMRARRDPNATVEHGFSHSVVCIMAARAYHTGRRLFFDPATQTIRDSA